MATPSRSPPPPYERLHTGSPVRPIRSTRPTPPAQTTETTPILAGQSQLHRIPQNEPRQRRSVSRQHTQEPATQTSRTVVFSFEKFVYLWLGFGTEYSVLCLLIFALFVGWGIALVAVAAATNNFSSWCYRLVPVNVLSMIAGVLFILLGVFRILAHIWQKRQIKNFAPLGCCIWILSMLFAAVFGGLGVELYEHREHLLPIHVLSPYLINGSIDKECVKALNCSMCDQEYCYLNRYTPLAATSSIGIITFMFLCCNMLCYFCVRKKVGRICC